MKFLSTLFAAGAVATSLGTPVVKKASLVERDIATVTSAISSISDATTQLGNSLQSFTGAGQAAALQSASENVISTIKSGTTAVEGSAQLTQEEALTLTTPVQNLAGLVNTTVDAAIAKKQTLVDAGVGSIVYDQLTQQRDAAKAFSDAVTAKVPDALKSIAASLAAPISASLDRGVAAFQDQQGTGGGATSGSTSGSASASASGGASSGAGGVSPTGSASASVTGGSGTNGTVTATSTSAAAPTVSEFTGAAMPTAFVEFGAVAAAALAAVVAL